MGAQIYKYFQRKELPKKKMSSFIKIKVAFYRREQFFQKKGTQNLKVPKKKCFILFWLEKALKQIEIKKKKKKGWDSSIIKFS